MKAASSSFLLAVVFAWCAGVSAQQAAAEHDIGYPSVAAALQALQARPNVTISVQDGWTVANDSAENALWSFTPPGHPAHPAAVKRSMLEKDGAVFIEMQALCEAGKAPCDQMIEGFHALNAQIREAMQRRAAASSTQWTPSPQQAARADETVAAYFAAIDAGRYRDAYAFFGDGFKSVVSFEKFEGIERSFLFDSGGDPSRTTLRVKWHKDPANAPAPGIYAVFHVTCKFRNIERFDEVLMLHEQGDGTFTLVGQERNLANNKSAQQVRESQKQ